MKVKKLLLICFVLLIGFIAFSSCNKVLFKNDNIPASNEIYEKAKILKILDVQGQSKDNYLQEYKVELKMLSGKYKGQTFKTTFTHSGNPSMDIKIIEGDKVIIYLNEEGGELVDIHIADIARFDWLSVLMILFVFLLILIGGWKGVKAIVALGFTILGIFKLLIPAIVNGYSPLPITIFVAALVTVLTMIIIAGFTRKSVSAMIGTIAGVLIAGLLALVFGELCHLNGIASEECRMILLSPSLEVDLEGLLFSGIIIGALGAIMDVTMSIASSIEEIHRANNTLSRKELIRRGMNVGKDIMGTMTNTLILAYTGGSLPLMFLYATYNVSSVKVFNLEIISTEIIRALVGSIGLVLSVPVTAFVSGYLIKHSKNNVSLNKALKN
ncbi:MAG: YibE/F family protein [Caldisericia bacterium]|nr:YibE/F family protein [Caldisericia bacterium]